MRLLLTFLAVFFSAVVDKVQSQTGLTGAGLTEFGPLDPFGSGIFAFQVTTTEKPCYLRPHSKTNMYEELIPGFSWTPRYCPPGTLYSTEACACHNIDVSQIFVCRPELQINFDRKVIDDSSGNQISVRVVGTVDNFQNAGRFNGSGVLFVLQYAKQSFGTKLTITLRFNKQPGGATNEQVLISNCIGGRFGSVEIALDQSTREIIFRVQAKSDGTPEQVELRQPYREREWTNVRLMYDGSTVTAQVDGSSVTAPLQGNIGVRYNGMMIGSCHGRGYLGYIDDVRLYRCLA